MTYFESFNNIEYTSLLERHYSSDIVAGERVGRQLAALTEPKIHIYKSDILVSKMFPPSYNRSYTVRSTSIYPRTAQIKLAGIYQCMHEHRALARSLNVKRLN